MTLSDYPSRKTSAKSCETGCRFITGSCCDRCLLVRPSRGTENLQADARPLQETAQSMGGWHLSWCGVDCVGQRAIPYSPGIRCASRRPKRLRRVTASVGGGKNVGLVEPMSSIEQRLRRVEVIEELALSVWCHV